MTALEYIEATQKGTTPIDLLLMQMREARESIAALATFSGGSLDGVAVSLLMDEAHQLLETLTQYTAFSEPQSVKLTALVQDLQVRSESKRAEQLVGKGA